MKLFLFLALFPLMEALWLPTAKNQSEVKVSDQTDCLGKTIWANTCSCLYGEQLKHLYNFEECEEVDRDTVESECGDSSYGHLMGRCRHFSKLCSRKTVNNGNACRMLNDNSDDLTPCYCTSDRGNCHKKRANPIQENKRMKNCCLAMFFCQLGRSSVGGKCQELEDRAITFKNVDSAVDVVNSAFCLIKK